MRLTIEAATACPDALDRRQGGLGRETMAELGVEPGDVVLVDGDDRTAVTVVSIEEGKHDVLYLTDVDRRNAGVAAGDAATVERIDPPVAERVDVRMTSTLSDSYDVQGGTDFVRRKLDGHPVSVGDSLQGSVLGGSITLTFVVEDAVPDGPVVVGPETAVTVEDGAGAGDGGRGHDRTVTYDEVAGLEAELRAVRQLVELPLSRPALRQRLGGTDSGVLLYGPPGTGKTLLARAVGTEADAAFVPVTPASRFYDGTVDGEAVVRAATNRTPAIVFIDDVDVLAPASGDGGTKRSAAALADALDALADRPDVTVLAATSDPDAVDASLRRGGRLGHEIEVGSPDSEARRAILAAHLRDVPTAGVDVDELAERTRGYVGADLALLVSKATQEAVERLAGSGPEPAADVDPTDAIVTTADVEAALEAVVPSGLRETHIEQPDVGYDDIGGLDGVKRELIRAVEWPLRYPELFEALRSEAPTGVLLYGPPGTGKTMLARAVANSSDANFIPVNGPELFDRYVGESERSVREVFERARRNAPTVVFFDELDALAARRAPDSDAGATDRVVSQLLTELDGIEPMEDVVVVGATNRPELLDEALRRPGRLERELEVPLPDRAAREEIFGVHMADVPVADVDRGRLAAATDGYSGSDIAAIVREASMLAMEDHLRANDFEVDGAELDDLAVHGRHFDRALAEVDPSVTDGRNRESRR